MADTPLKAVACPALIGPLIGGGTPKGEIKHPEGARGGPGGEWLDDPPGDPGGMKGLAHKGGREQATHLR